MAKVTEITELFQHFVSELPDSFWGDMYGRTRVAWQQFWNTESLRARDQWMELDPYQRADGEREYRNGFYERDYVRRRTRPMVCFVNVESVDRIIYSIFQRFNLDWKNHTLKLFTQAA